MSLSGLWRLLIAFSVVFNLFTSQASASSITVYRRVDIPSSATGWVMYDSQSVGVNNCIRTNSSGGIAAVSRSSEALCLAAQGSLMNDYKPVFGNAAYPLPYELMRALLQFLIFHGCMLLMTKMFMLGT